MGGEEGRERRERFRAVREVLAREKIDRWKEGGRKRERERDYHVIDLYNAKIPENDHDINLLGNCFLYRGGSLLLVGPTGVGKSSLALQMGINFSCGRSSFGIKPEKPLSILYYLGEGLDRSLIRKGRSIIKKGDLNGEWLKRNGKFHLIHDFSIPYGGFLRSAEEMLSEYNYDILIIDPLFSFCTGNVSDQENMSRFLRHDIQKMLLRHNTGIIIVHHIPKPSIEGASVLDLAYAGFGSTELPNWARSTLVLSRGEERGHYTLHAAKNGIAAGWTDKSGKNPVWEKHLLHNPVIGEPDKVYWSEGEEGGGEDSIGGKREINLGMMRYRGVHGKIINLLIGYGEEGLSFEDLVLNLSISSEEGRRALRHFLTDLLLSGWKKAGYSEPWFFHDRKKDVYFISLLLNEKGVHV